MAYHKVLPNDPAHSPAPEPAPERASRWQYPWWDLKPGGWFQFNPAMKVATARVLAYQNAGSTKFKYRVYRGRDDNLYCMRIDGLPMAQRPNEMTLPRSEDHPKAPSGDMETAPVMEESWGHQLVYDGKGDARGRMVFVEDDGSVAEAPGATPMRQFIPMPWDPKSPEHDLWVSQNPDDACSRGLISQQECDRMKGEI